MFNYYNHYSYNYNYSYNYHNHHLDMSRPSLVSESFATDAR